MQILLVSDTESKYIWEHFDKDRFKNVELVISCGDLKAEYLSYIVTMINAPLLYVHGNHDKGYIQKPPEGCDCIDDKIVTIKGVRIMGLGGSQMYNTGPFQYSEAEMCKRIRKLWAKLFFKGGVDILVTHAGAFGVGDDEDQCHLGFKCFNNFMDKYHPKYMFHGHTHLSYGNKKRIEKYNSTMVINAYEYHLIEF